MQSLVLLKGFPTVNSAENVPNATFGTFLTPSSSLGDSPLQEALAQESIFQGFSITPLLSVSPGSAGVDF